MYSTQEGPSLGPQRLCADEHKPVRNPFMKESLIQGLNCTVLGLVGWSGIWPTCRASFLPRPSQATAMPNEVPHSFSRSCVVHRGLDRC